MRKTIYLIFCYLAISLFFVSCKKYPEDNLWFKKPEKQLVLIGYLTRYQVNNIDSLDLLNYYLPTATQMNIRECRFTQGIEHGKIEGRWMLGPMCSSPTSQSFSDNGKKIRIRYALNGCINRDVFMDQYWTIINFPTKKHPGLKLKAVINGNTYEIQITN